MKKAIILILIILFITSSTAFAKSIRVRGGFTKSGTYKTPHYRTSPNRTKLDNWSTKGNINPFTGKKGNINPYRLKFR